MQTQIPTEADLAIQYDKSFGIAKYKYTNRISILCRIFWYDVIPNGYPKTGTNLYKTKFGIYS